ncbi:MAG: RdgB/HAM1 family non-canonical purine NTP pyrophosphatase [Prevotella sp.]|nr:RdgB/HAM1 family non-canonical purine NTP pyrophosphatase [Staphylococcus sp.]MCM1349709.1 RdgB/HAM1 family non-canonical purine NTP pyrophosphatase [Prevotella sp.]
MKVLLATKNKHKVKELVNIFENSQFNIEILNLSDFPEIEEPIEDGMTFLENAIIKAHYYYAQFGIPVISDDSGIVVDALEGRPGIYSARYASMDQSNASSADNRKKLLSEMEGITQRSAHFECAMVYYDGKQCVTSTGKTEGLILEEEIGHNGFGYDTLFYVSECEKAMGLLSEDEKNQISHRGKASRALIQQLLMK